MKILASTLENFGSFRGKHTVQFQDRGLVFVDGENLDEPKMVSNGCLVGDTLIDCPRDLGKYPKGIPLRTLVGKRPWVYAWQGRKIVVRRASKVWKTKQRAKVVRIRLTKYATRRGSGQGDKYLPPQELVGTADHPVLLADRKTWKPLGELVPGDRVCSMYRRESGGWRTLLHWTGSGTMRMGSRRGHRTVSEQQFVCGQMNKKPRGDWEVHHIDDNPYNHSPKNLEWKRKGEHQSYHTSKRNRAGLAGWKVSGRHPRGMKGKQHTPEVRARISKTLREAWRTGRRGKQAPGVNHTVLSVEPAGYRAVYDMRVPGADSFVANGVVVHNSGKSTIFDAPDWCFFGKVPKGDVADSIVNDFEGAQTCVTTRLDDDGVPGTIQRFRKCSSKSGVRLWIGCHIDDWVEAQEEQWAQYELTTMDSKETQKLIEKFLGLDRDVFHAAVYRAQGQSFNFAAAKDAERKRILTKLLQLDEIDLWLDNAKAKSEENNKGHLEALQVAQNLAIQTQTLEAQDVTTSITEWETQRGKRVEQFRVQYGMKKVEIDQLTAQAQAFDHLKMEFDEAQR